MHVYLEDTKSEKKNNQLESSHLEIISVNILMHIFPDVQRMPWHITNALKAFYLIHFNYCTQNHKPSHRQAT